MKIIAKMSHHDISPVDLALENSCILYNIFKYLPLSELITCSRLNGFWNNEVRTFLRDHREVVVKVAGPTPCLRLKLLDDMIREFTVVPCTGLVISPREYNESSLPCDNCKILLAQGDDFLTGWNPKYIDIDWRVYYLQGSCPPVSLMKRLLERKAGHLETLVLGELHSNFLDHFEDDGNDDERNPVPIVFPMLRAFQSRYNRISKGMMTKILAGAPILDRIIATFTPKNIDCVPPSKFKYVETFQLSLSENPEDLAKIMQFSEANPTLQRLEVNTCNVGGKFNPQILFQTLCASSAISLQKLVFDAAFILADDFRLPELVNLRTVKICTGASVHTLEKAVWKFFSFSTLPALTTVELSLTIFCMFSALFQPAVVNIGQITPCQTVTTLALQNHGADTRQVTSVLENLMTLFPEISEFSLSGTIPFHSIFSLWPDLTSLDIELPQSPKKFEYDAMFCGINEEEVMELLQQDRKFLQQVHIVPIKPALRTLSSKILSKCVQEFVVLVTISIFCILDLTALKVRAMSQEHMPRASRYFSLFTDLVVLQRWRELDVSVFTPSRR